MKKALKSILAVVLALTMIIGVALQERVFLITSAPSMSGSPKSRIMTSGR